MKQQFLVTFSDKRILSRIKLNTHITNKVEGEIGMAITFCRPGISRVWLPILLLVS